jgi:hypothetical protein
MDMVSRIFPNELPGNWDNHLLDDSCSKNYHFHLLWCSMRIILDHGQ